MKQVYHSNASTNVRLRCEINNSKLSNKKLILKYNVSEKTIAKWKNRDVFEDKSSRPNTIKYALSDLEMLIATKLRVLTWWALDEITEAINPSDPHQNKKCCVSHFCARRNQ